MEKLRRRGELRGLESSETEKESNLKEKVSEIEYESGESSYPDTSYCSSDEDEWEQSDPREGYNWFKGEDKIIFK